ncbi:MULTISPECIES: hypothetical protein [Bacillus]|uniref:Uncharacterized protein n=1 Tax=Bacillus glycinifermentans TaxID=1664069 RepID=A0A0T6BN62_9BACI|nr:MULTISPECIES: hypothetical protein [Bacillus]KRT93090.1 hypothetical protein AB447_203920 [Bacillus glycinifermentans]MEC0341929.1 hypothetical protein [Bacillus sonorensis]MEC0457385.1 hypothetical protein [Bacillus sonorensis]MEC0487901.1 hypothetical protein [Bacillus glycinifermentans]MEC0530648.1 hypothetical protein [Bacillus sonorensis]
MFKGIQIFCLVVVFAYFFQMLFFYRPSIIEMTVLVVTFFATGVCSLVHKFFYKGAILIFIASGMYIKSVYYPFESFKEIVYVALILFALFSIGFIQSLKDYTKEKAAD